MYTFTDSDIAWAVVRAKDRGVAIKLYLDSKEVNSEYSKSRFFINPLGQKTMGLPMDEWEGGDMLQCAYGDKTFRTQRLSYRVSYRMDPEISTPNPKSWITRIPEKTFS